jgi:hypothetical protein
VTYRPLGKSNLQPSPWSNDQNDDYVPSVMSEEAVKVGLQKHNFPEINFPEHLVKRAEAYIYNKMKSIWTDQPEDLMRTYEDALDQLQMDKSPGYPYFYDCKDKEEALNKYGVEIKDRVDRMLLGEEVESIFALTAKSELRTKDRVAQNKTRVFMASDMHHLITSLMLFDKQNEKIMNTRGLHPCTIGIQIPGPEFARSILGLGDQLNDGDVSGCDLLFKLRLARSIRELRSRFLPSKYGATIIHLYNCVYAGLVAGLGGMYRIFGNKSGWLNTGMDNTLMCWLCLIIACFHFFPDRSPEDVIESLINGDDLLVNQKLGCFREFCAWLKTYNFFIEAEDWTPRAPTEVVFLSHHLERRFVRGFGDFVCSAGNLVKIKSSLNWIKKSDVLSFSECCVARLVGLRLCAFPWQVEFEEIDQILSTYLRSVIKTPFIQQCLKARLSEYEIAVLHTRVEGFNFLPLAIQSMEESARIAFTEYCSDFDWSALNVHASLKFRYDQN